jgi:hypothetical protein
MLGTLFTGLIGGVCAWFLTDYVAKPLRRFFDLRREINRCLINYGNVRSRAEWTPIGRVTAKISPEEDAQLTKAQHAFLKLGAEMRAFANEDRVANRAVRALGCDADKIASALVAYSNQISTSGELRYSAYRRLQKLLRIRGERISVTWDEGRRTPPDITRLSELLDRTDLDSLRRPLPAPPRQQPAAREDQTR